MLSGPHGRRAGFPSSEGKREALLVADAQSHTFQLRFEAPFPHQDSTNEGRPRHRRSD